MSNMFTIDKVEAPILDLEKLADTWKATYPGFDATDRARVLEEAKRLVPEGINYIVEEDESKDPAKKILLAALKDQQIILVGPKGTGKTTSIYHVAQETNTPLVPVQLNGSTGVDTLIGKWLVNESGTYWIDGLFTLAWKYGFWIILDELNMALPEITAVLHPALDDRRILVLDEKNGEVLKRHPNCRIFAAINPTEDYAGTKEMNAALLDRFAGQVVVTYPEPRKERAIIMGHRKVEIDDVPMPRTKEGVITRMVKVANMLRKTYNEQTFGFECSTRNLLDWACWCKDLPVKEACEFAIVSKIPDREDQDKMREIVGTVFKDDEMWLPVSERKVAKKLIEDMKMEEPETEDVEMVNF